MKDEVINIADFLNKHLGPILPIYLIIGFIVAMFIFLFVVLFKTFKNEKMFSKWRKTVNIGDIVSIWPNNGAVIDGKITNIDDDFVEMNIKISKNKIYPDKLRSKS